jgi:hypothetical protein
MFHYPGLSQQPDKQPVFFIFLVREHSHAGVLGLAGSAARLSLDPGVSQQPEDVPHGSIFMPLLGSSIL